jgi:hypothetical protein
MRGGKEAWQWEIDGIISSTSPPSSLMQPTPDDTAGPTAERLKKAGDCFTVAGRAKSTRKFTMCDDALGRAWMRRIISGEEYTGLRRYALHWLASGLQGHLNSIDLNRILAFNPSAMTGLAKTERQADHRQLYWMARARIGARPALVADKIACEDVSIEHMGMMLGYKSRYWGRAKATELLREAGYRLHELWIELAKRN